MVTKIDEPKIFGGIDAHQHRAEPNGVDVAKDTIYTWVTSKGMPGHKVGRFWKFKKEDVDAWVREGGAAASSDDFDDKEPRNA